MMGWMENKPCSYQNYTKDIKKKKKKIKYKEDKHESLLYNISMGAHTRNLSNNLDIRYPISVSKKFQFDFVNLGHHVFDVKSLIW